MNKNKTNGKSLNHSSTPDKSPSLQSVDLRENPMGIYEKALPPFRDWEEALETTRRCGFDFLELSVDESDDRLQRLYWTDQERQNLKRAILDTGVPVRHICLSGHRKFPFASNDSAIREKAWDIMQRGLDLAVELGVRIIQTQGHDVYYETSTDVTWKRYTEALVRAAEMARAASVMIGLENADIPRVGSADQANEIIDLVGNPWFQMYPDIGNIFAHGFEVPEQLIHAYRHIVAVHIKDARPGVFRRVPFGDGAVPFDDAFRTLGNLNYRGPFVIEMWNEGSEDPEGVIRNAREWVHSRMEP
ncbi:MAG: L-ribulose-5-phosphate 3-epimerase [Alkalispirochaeta sp.]